MMAPEDKNKLEYVTEGLLGEVLASGPRGNASPRLLRDDGPERGYRGRLVECAARPDAAARHDVYARGPRRSCWSRSWREARRRRVVVRGRIYGRHSVFYAGETSVEIEVRGDFIVDCNGQPVDANAVGLLTTPTGNGTPGGTFLSSLRVGKRPAKGASS